MEEGGWDEGARTEELGWGPHYGDDTRSPLVTQVLASWLIEGGAAGLGKQTVPGAHTHI